MNGERIDQDIEESLRLLHEAARCIDRIHRSLFIDADEHLMSLADKAQRHIRIARKTSERMHTLRNRNITSDRSRQPVLGTPSPNGS